jgi:sterol desaturase/sphingolipid hydroxylase (fatty acid hydroxylase superfamily)
MWAGLIGVLGAVAFLAAGRFWPRFDQPLLRPDSRADLLHAVVNGAILDVPLAVIVRHVAAALEKSGGIDAGLLAHAPLWQQTAVFVLAGDLLKWSIHRLHHAVPVLWQLHRLHHSTEQMDSLSHARSHPLEFLINRIPFQAIFVVVLGVDLRIIAAYSVVDLLQGLWVHSNTHVRTKWLNFVFATQEFHHWHHATDPAAMNKNFGGFLSVWDWVFGTAYCPTNREVQRFGIPEVRAGARYRDHLLFPFRDRELVEWSNGRRVDRF